MGDWYVYNGDVFDGPSKIGGMLSTAVKHNNDVRQLHIENERLRARVEELENGDAGVWCSRFKKAERLRLDAEDGVRHYEKMSARAEARAEELEANDGEGHKRCACVWSDNDEVIRPCVAHLWSWSKHNEARAEEYEEELKADRAFCICGCPVADHESYGEDGISCGHDDHECLFTCAAIAAGYQELQREVERLKGELKSCQLTAFAEVSGIGATLLQEREDQAYRPRSRAGEGGGVPLENARGN